jgi:hypothetical protein
MDPQMMEMMPPEAMAGMDPLMMEMMPPEAIAAMPPEAMTGMPPEAVAAMEAFQAAIGDGMSPADAKESVMQSMDPEAMSSMDDGGLGALSAALEPPESAPTQMMDATSEVLDFALSESQAQGAPQAMNNDTLDEAFEVADHTADDVDEHNEEHSAPDDPLV